MTVRQLRKLLLGAAENPGTIPDVVARRIEAEARQSSLLDGFTFCLQPGAGPAPAALRPATANQIDQLLRSRATWPSAHGSGRPPRRSAAR